jgi:hypothetical protein
LGVREARCEFTDREMEAISQASDSMCCLWAPEGGSISTEVLFSRVCKEGIVEPKEKLVV